MMALLFAFICLLIIFCWFRKRKLTIYFSFLTLLLGVMIFYHHFTNTLNINL